MALTDAGRHPSSILAFCSTILVRESCHFRCARCLMPAKAKGINRRTAAEALVRVDPKLATKCLAAIEGMASLALSHQRVRLVTASAESVDFT